jgi:hypothetical protein
LAKFATVRAIKDFVISSIRFLKVFRQWDPVWQYRANDPCFYHGVAYCANPDNIPAPGESPETHSMKWNIIGGAGSESGATYNPTANRVTKFDDTARLRSGARATEPNHVIRKEDLNRRVRTLQLVSKKSLLLSNAKQALRRQRGWDLGIPYLSFASEVYHFDTDYLNQNQESHISIIQENSLQLIDENSVENGIILDPAVSGIPPHEIINKSLLGEFSIKGILQGVNVFTIDFWVRFVAGADTTLFRINSSGDCLEFYAGNIDSIEYSIPETGDIPYSIADDGDIAYSIADSSKNLLTHYWNNDYESIDLSKMGIEINDNVWEHFAIVLTPNKICLFLKDFVIDFNRKSTLSNDFSFFINPDKNRINIDELLIDGATVITQEQFVENTQVSLPWAKLPYDEDWLILEAADIEKVKTNLFKTEIFRQAVLGVINDQ